MGNFVEFYEFLRLQMVFGIVRCSDSVILIQLFYEINSEQVSLNLRCSMEQYLIKGGNPLVGEVEISGAKNSALGILAAAIMCDETVTIRNLPDVNDINVFLNAVISIGAEVHYPNPKDRHTVKINGRVSVPMKWTMIISERSERPIISSVPFWASTEKQVWHCRADAISAADRSTSIRRALRHLERRYGSTEG